MTKINYESPVVRETASTYKDKPITVELHTSYLVFRVKGMQKFRASVSYEGAFHRALEGEASQAAIAKSAGKPRKVSRGLIKTGRKDLA